MWVPLVSYKDCSIRVYQSALWELDRHRPALGYATDCESTVVTIGCLFIRIFQVTLI